MEPDSLAAQKRLLLPDKSHLLFYTGRSPNWIRGHFRKRPEPSHPYKDRGGRARGLEKKIGIRHATL